MFTFSSLEKALYSFSTFGRKEWLKLAKQALAGRNPQQAFLWKYDPEISLEAYYEATSHAVSGQQQRSQPSLVTAKRESLPKWQALLYISSLQLKEARAFARLMQQPSCDALLYDMGQQPQKLPSALLKIIQLRKLPIYYRLGTRDSSVRAHFFELLKHKQLPVPAALWEARGPEDPWARGATSSIDNTALQAAGAAPSLQIAHALSALSAYLKKALQAEIPLSEALNKVLLVQAAEPDYYHEIAKLRALRLCMAKVAVALGAKRPWQARILGTTNPQSSSFLEPSMNLLHNTVQILALVLGGVSHVLPLLHVHPQGATDPATTARWALNIAQLLRTEAHMKEINDPAAGSYFLEHLSDTLARRGWEKFQHIEAKGGLQNPSAQKELLKACQHNTKNKAEALYTGKQVRIGINKYVQASATTYFPPAHKASELYMHAYPSVAAPYERLRLRSHHFFQKRVFPQLHMVTLEGTASIAILRRYLQDLWEALGFVCPEMAAAPEDALPEGPFIWVGCITQEESSAGLAILKKQLAKIRAQSPLTSYVAGLEEAIPRPLSSVPKLHYLSFPRDASLAGWEGVQNLLFDEISRF